MLRAQGHISLLRNRVCYAEFFAQKFYFRFCVLFFPGSEVVRLPLVFKLFLKLFGFSNFQEFCFCISIMY